MEFKKEILDNGLAVIGEFNPAAKSAAVGFFVRAGSRDETPQISGTSHFLEHMIFKGTETLSPLEVNQAFDDTGALFNAFTSEETTVYYAAVLPEYLEDITKLWSQLLRPSLRDEDFDLEKNVILEEMAMYEDMPHWDVLDKARTLYFQSHPCGNSVIGTRKSITELTSKQMRDYFSNRYAPNNITLCFAGNFDWDKMMQLAKDNCGYWQSQTVERHLLDYEGAVNTDKLEKQSVTRQHICLVSRFVSMQDKKRYAASLLGKILGDSVGSRYFWALVDNALAETASVSCDSMDGTGAMFSYIRCSNENEPKVIDTLRNIFKEIESNGMTQVELTAAKNKTLSALALKNEVPMGRLITVGFNWLYLNEYRDIEADIEAIKTVTLDEVNSLINQLKPGNFSRFTICGTAQ